ncbi:hypothetical protein HAX54_021331, partial [Datura stramonium]|nr:hypothetical protein [Datura stramonium]
AARNRIFDDSRFILGKGEGGEEGAALGPIIQFAPTDRHGYVVKETLSLSFTDRTATLSGFLRDRFTLLRLTECRKPSTGRRSCFSHDLLLLMSAFSLLISLGLVTKNFPQLTERSATDT